MDHGITNGVLPGLEDIGGLIKKVGKGGADAVLLHKGNAKNVIYSQNEVLKSFGRELGLIIHLNGAPSIGSDPYLKIPKFVSSMSCAIWSRCSIASCKYWRCR